jgi:hypothetical protein
LDGLFYQKENILMKESFNKLKMNLNVDKAGNLLENVMILRKMSF